MTVTPELLERLVKAVALDDENAIDLGEIPPEGESIVRVRGVKGDRGDKGDKGDRGEQGIPGLDGIGEIGPQGLQGIEGPPGTDGVDGLKGDRGLRGQKGEIGDRGLQGFDGKDGEQGRMGPRGPQGIPGKGGGGGGSSGSGTGSALAVKDEGVSLDAAVTSIDFAGAGVTATNTGHAITVTIPGGAVGVDGLAAVLGESNDGAGLDILDVRNIVNDGATDSGGLSLTAKTGATNAQVTLVTDGEDGSTATVKSVSVAGTTQVVLSPTILAIYIGNDFGSTGQGLVSDGAGHVVWEALTETIATAHVADTIDAHDASAVSYDPTGDTIIEADNVQSAVEQIEGILAAHLAAPSAATYLSVAKWGVR